ncbi:PIG-L family deacetylase [Halomonas cupida]|uniref:GlcNAc-PI de-N-acetylase n=3 Tax=Halomonas cupida TaxID=44933 RepID=A0A1M7LUA2_9GAMM|nr:PIG-L family deacetylase [Halomonas cupida]SHM81896.1 GlcNAc-PI de-N-acetylase [Halomonas cupida]
MPQHIDHHLPLEADLSCPARIAPSGKLVIEDATYTRLINELPDLAGMTWMLQLRYRSTSRFKLPAVTTLADDEPQFTQYFEANQAGERLLNLTGPFAPHSVQLDTRHCQLDEQVTLLGFTRPNLDDGPLLIIAPHPDDAELAAYGLYQQHARDTWILTLTAGETLKRLDRQYLPGLDADQQQGSQRKGFIRAWNSATTPLLAGVPQAQLVMLGYFNDTLSRMLDNPAETVPSVGGPEVSIAPFRQWNKAPLPSDVKRKQDPIANSGENLLHDLVSTLDLISPTTIIVTHPDIDPHQDHRAAAIWLGKALQQCQEKPKRILMYANHLKGCRNFPRGPAYAAAGIWPTTARPHGDLSVRLLSHYLAPETIRQKAVAMDSMHDLRGKPRLEKSLKRKLATRLQGLPPAAASPLGEHDYFVTHLKAHETFTSATPDAFIAHVLTTSD